MGVFRAFFNVFQARSTEIESESDEMSDEEDDDDEDGEFSGRVQCSPS